MSTTNGALTIKSASGSIPSSNGHATATSSLSPKIWRVAMYLDQCFGQTITLRQAAAIVDLHPDYLSRRFKREIGVGLHDYLVTLRLQHATALLVSTTKSIKEISYDVGFRAPEVFSKAFKRQMGCSPTTYRAHHLPSYGRPAGWTSDASVSEFHSPRVPEVDRADHFDRLADFWDEH